MVPALAQACGSVGSPQIRNIATLSGNVVNAQPAADSAIALIALDAKAVIQNPSGTRTEPVESLFAGPGQSRVDSTSEILTSFVIERTRENRATAYGRISPRTSLCLPIVNTGVTLQVDDRGKICDAKIVIAPVAKTPLLAESACQALIGGDVDDEDLFVRAASEASRAANPRSSCLRGCSDYRKQLVYVLTRRIIAQAASTLQARQKGK
jgi:carbon-monoxide dehydrogenase medium subunit